jgi:predicted HicB family RNase H-like nuclease
MIKVKSNYLKIVEWSAEDQCFIGTAPGLILGGIHGDNQQKVFKDLCTTVDEIVLRLEKEGRPIPPQAIKNQYSGKIALRITPELHRTLAIKALRNGESVNKYIEETLSNDGA